MNYPPYQPHQVPYQQGQQYYNSQQPVPQSPNSHLPPHPSPPQFAHSAHPAYQAQPPHPQQQHHHPQQRYPNYPPQQHNVQHYQQNGYMPQQARLPPPPPQHMLPQQPPMAYGYQHHPQQYHPAQMSHHVHPSVPPLQPQQQHQQQHQQQQQHQHAHIQPQPQQFQHQRQQHMPPPPQVVIPSPQQQQQSLPQYDRIQISREVPSPVTTPQQQPAPRPQVQQSPKVPPPPSPKQVKQPLPEIDAGTAIALGEEYIAAACKLRRDSEPDDLPESYHQILSLGLGCLKSALVKGKLQPSTEAAVRLRYASLLFAETTNNIEVDLVLSNGIGLCDRHRLLDLKYDMMQLQARAMYSTNPKAALKYLDKVIKDMDMHKHMPWLYAFRFLRASLSLSTRQQQEVVVAIHQLRQIAEKAAGEGDSAVAALASSLEAHVHVSRANSKDAIDQAQRALASALSLQLDPQVQAVPQLILMPHFVDVACSIYQAEIHQSQNKMQSLQNTLDSLTESEKWSDDGTFEVPMSERTSRNMTTSNKEAGTVRRNNAGRLCLRLNWLDKEQLYGFGYLVNAIVMHHKTAGDESGTAEKLLQEAKVMFVQSETSHPRRNVSDGNGGSNYNDNSASTGTVLQAFLHANRIFELFSRHRWAVARQEVLALEKTLSSLPSDAFSPWEALVHYLQGILHQGTGNLKEAIVAYQHSSLALPKDDEDDEDDQKPLQQQQQQQQVQPHNRTPYQRDLSVLATMNLLLIIRMPSHPLHATYAQTLARLQPLVVNSPSRNVFSAYNLMRAATPDLQTTASILETKSFLQTALQAARATANNQLMCITLNILSFKFFRGVVGEQAEKSGRATQTLARKGKDTLWLSVADAALSETLEAQGKTDEARQVWREAIDVAAKLPDSMRSMVAEGKEHESSPFPQYAAIERDGARWSAGQN